MSVFPVEQTAMTSVRLKLSQLTMTSLKSNFWSRVNFPVAEPGIKKVATVEKARAVVEKKRAAGEKTKAA